MVRKSLLNSSSFPNINANFQQIVRPNLIKIRPVGSKLFHVAERRDMTKVTVACRKPDDARKSRLHNLGYWKTKS